MSSFGSKIVAPNANDSNSRFKILTRRLSLSSSFRVSTCNQPNKPIYFPPNNKNMNETKNNNHSAIILPLRSSPNHIICFFNLNHVVCLAPSFINQPVWSFLVVLLYAPRVPPATHGP